MRQIITRLAFEKFYEFKRGLFNKKKKQKI